MSSPPSVTLRRQPTSVQLQASISGERLVILPLDVSLSMPQPSPQSLSCRMVCLHILINNAGVSLCKISMDCEFLRESDFPYGLNDMFFFSFPVPPRAPDQHGNSECRDPGFSSFTSTRNVLFMTTILAFITLADQFNILSTFSASKAALNMTIKKWATQLAGEGLIIIPVRVRTC